jgi:hypothetical protein
MISARLIRLTRNPAAWLLLVVALTCGPLTLLWRPAEAQSVQQPPVRRGAALPAQCVIGSLFVRTGEAAGLNLHVCTSSNTWTRAAYSQGLLAARPATCSIGQTYFVTDASAGNNWTGCTALNTWTTLGGGGGGGSAPTIRDWAGAVTARANVVYRDNLTVTDSGGEDRTYIDYTAIDPRTVQLADEFANANTNSGAIGSLGWNRNSIGGTPVLQYQLASWPNIGVLRVSTPSASSAQGGSITLGTNATNVPLGPLVQQTNWRLIWVFRLGQTAELRFRIGICKGCEATATGTDFVGLRYDTNLGDGATGTWRLIHRISTPTETAYDTGISADTAWHTLRMYSTVAGGVIVQLDGNAAWTVCNSGCTLVPPTITTSQMDAALSIVNDAAAAKFAEVDFFGFSARVQTTDSIYRRQ